jgi:pimeloyl-ACP methyl ester carboxylesterase
MFAAISGQHVQPERTIKRFGWLIFSKYNIWLLDMAIWFMTGMARVFPRWTIKLLFNGTANEDFRTQEELECVMRRPEQIASLQQLIQLNSPFGIRKPGLDNDLETFAGLSVYPLEHITCPTLVVHGRADGNVPFSHAEFVGSTIPNAEMYVVEDGSHLIWIGLGADQMKSAIIDFLKDNSTIAVN